MASASRRAVTAAAPLASDLARGADAASVERDDHGGEAHAGGVPGSHPRDRLGEVRALDLDSSDELLAGREHELDPHFPITPNAGYADRKRTGPGLSASRALSASATSAPAAATSPRPVLIRAMSRRQSSRCSRQRP